MNIRAAQLNVKNEMGLSNGPDDLIEGMAEFLKDVGVQSSFLDEEDLIIKG